MSCVWSLDNGDWLWQTPVTKWRSSEVWPTRSHRSHHNIELRLILNENFSLLTPILSSELFSSQCWALIGSHLNTELWLALLSILRFDWFSPLVLLSSYWFSSKYWTLIDSYFQRGLPDSERQKIQNNFDAAKREDKHQASAGPDTATVDTIELAGGQVGSGVNILS